MILNVLLLFNSQQQSLGSFKKTPPPKQLKEACIVSPNTLYVVLCVFASPESLQQRCWMQSWHNPKSHNSHVYGKYTAGWISEFSFNFILLCAAALPDNITLHCRKTFCSFLLDFPALFLWSLRQNPCYQHSGFIKMNMWEGL